MQVALYVWACADNGQVIDRAQIRLFEQAKGKPLNVLTAGYRRVSNRYEIHCTMLY